MFAMFASSPCPPFFRIFEIFCHIRHFRYTAVLALFPFLSPLPFLRIPRISSHLHILHIFAPLACATTWHFPALVLRPPYHECSRIKSQDAQARVATAIA